jgi:hypothetical protein
MSVRVRYKISAFVSSTTAEDKDLANQQWEILNDTQGEGGSWKTTIQPGDTNVPIRLGNLATARLLIVRTNAKDPTQILNAVTLRKNTASGVQSGPSSSFSFANPTVTYASTGAAFTADLIGKTITVAGATTPANNGSFVVATVPTSESITFVNTAAVSEAGAGAWFIPEGEALVVQPLGDSKEGHLALSTDSITALYATNPGGGVQVELTVVACGD